MSSRCAMLLGVPRSGTSCTAGVLHRLGVDMGQGHFQPKDWANPKGYYEDMRWRLATQRITGRGYSLKAAAIEAVGKQQRQIWRQLAREDAQKRYWGMKDPWLCFVGRFIWPILEQEHIDVRMIVTHRPRAASVASVRAHLNRTYHGKGNAETIIDTWQRGLDRQLREWSGPVFHVDYDALVLDPMPTVKALGEYVYDGLWPAGADIEAAAQWVTPKLRHHEGGR